MIDLTKDITLVIGIDAKTIEQLRISWRTWAKHRPLMWQWPWIIFYDHRKLYEAQVKELTYQMDHPLEWTKFVPWPERGVEYASQRETMLNGHVFVPSAHVNTAYHLKIDTDCLALNSNQPWPKTSWFENGPDIIAPHWGYTKGAGWLGRLEDWYDKVATDTKPLGIRQWKNYADDKKRVGHSRWCSWLSFYRTVFTQSVVNRIYARGEQRLPVPSQDTTMWYFGARQGAVYVDASMKSLGFNNYPSLHKLKQVAASIMGA